MRHVLLLIEFSGDAGRIQYHLAGASKKKAPATTPQGLLL
jgi:hypothetical protein